MGPRCAQESYKVTKLQSYKVTKLQSYKVTKLPSYKVTKLQSDQVTKLPSYKVTKWQSFRLKYSDFFKQEKINNSQTESATCIIQKVCYRESNSLKIYEEFFILRLDQKKIFD